MGVTLFDFSGNMEEGRVTPPPNTVKSDAPIDIEGLTRVITSFLNKYIEGENILHFNWHSVIMNINIYR